jgi:enoyl-CoA hydratase/carnithine racemase
MLEEYADGQVLLTRVESLLTITLQRPQAKNALTPAILAALPEILRAHLDCRLVVIRGCDCGAFSSGYDLKELGNSRPGDAADAGLESALSAVESFPRVTAAVIDGWCVGAGLELALSFDLRVATLRSRFCLPAATLGVSYPDHGLRRLEACVGRPGALRMVLLSEKWSAADAHRIGILHEVCDDLDRQVQEWHTEVNKADPAAIANMKRALLTIAQSRFESSSPDARINCEPVE